MAGDAAATGLKLILGTNTGALTACALNVTGAGESGRALERVGMRQVRSEIESLTHWWSYPTGGHVSVKMGEPNFIPGDDNRYSLYLGTCRN